MIIRFCLWSWHEDNFLTVKYTVGSNSTVLIPWTQDVTHICAIKSNLSRKTKVRIINGYQLVLLVCVVFCTGKQKRSRRIWWNMGWEEGTGTATDCTSTQDAVADTSRVCSFCLAVVGLVSEATRCGIVNTRTRSGEVNQSYWHHALEDY